jgi:hypothetical protein
LNEFFVRGIETCEVSAWVMQVNCCFDDVEEVQSVGVQDRGQVLHGLYCLLVDGGADGVTGDGIMRRLPRGV